MFLLSALYIACGTTHYNDDGATDEVLDPDSDLFTDTLSDPSADTRPDLNCTEGPCCHEGLLRTSYFECATEGVYRCVGGEVCGAELQQGLSHTYCSGTSPECDGEVVTDSWSTVIECDENHACNSMEGRCDLCSTGCDSEGCIPCTWTWEPISCDGDGCPVGTIDHAAVWMEEYGKMLVFGGPLSEDDNARLYDPIADDWQRTTFISSTMRFSKAVWTGSLALIWGGEGVRYDPFSDTASPMAEYGVPTIYRGHSMAWTGREMIVWGGSDTGTDGTDYGARYNPTTDAWAPTSIVSDTPSERLWQTAVWTGSEMIFWGGVTTGLFDVGLDSGGRYNPMADSWQSTDSSASSPGARYRHTAVWTGSEMIVWGGLHVITLADGFRYDPSGDSWTPASVGPDAPSCQLHTAVWTGKEMIVWGGMDSGVPLDEGGHYDPFNDEWRPTESVGAPEGRYAHTAVWTGSEMLVWGGRQGTTGPFTYPPIGGKYRCVP